MDDDPHDLDVRDPHIRSIEPEMRDDLEKGVRPIQLLGPRMVQLLDVERRYAEFTD